MNEYDMKVSTEQGELVVDIVGHEDVGFSLRAPQSAEDDRLFAWMVWNLSDLAAQAIKEILEGKDDE